MFSRSLAQRILILNLLLIVVPIMIYLLFFAGWEYEKEVLTRIYRLRDGTLLRASYLKQIIEDQFTALDFMVGMTDLNRPEAIDNLDTVMQHLDLPAIYSVASFLIRTPEGHYVEKYSTVKIEINRDLTYRGFVQTTVANGFSAYLAYDDLTLAKELIVTKAIHSRSNGELLGVLTFVFPGKFIFDTLTEDKYFASGETASLLTEDKIVFARSNEDLVFTAFAPVSAERVAELKANKQFGTYEIPKRTIELKPYSQMKDVFEWEEDGHTHMAFMAPVINASFYVLMEINKEVIAKPYHQTLLLTLVVLFAVTIVSCSVTIVLGHLLSMTFRELIRVMDKVATSDLSARYRNRLFGFEVNRAGSSLNKMLDRLVAETKQAEIELLKTATVSQQLKMGREIQLGLMTQNIPVAKGLEIGVFTRPAGGVSGEFYDIYKQADSLIITLSNSSIKGLSSCLFSFGLRSMIRSFATVYSDLSQILNKVNGLFYQDLKNTKVIVRTFIGWWDSPSSTLRYACAGFSFGFVKFPDGKIEPLSGFQKTMGAQGIVSFPSYSLPLEPGSIVVLYTSGVIEQQNKHGNFYGEAGLRALFEKNVFLGAQEIAKEIETDLEQFTDGILQVEDMTVIILKVTGEGRHV